MDYFGKQTCEYFSMLQQLFSQLWTWPFSVEVYRSAGPFIRKLTRWGLLIKWSHQDNWDWLDWKQDGIVRRPVVWLTILDEIAHSKSQDQKQGCAFVNNKKAFGWNKLY